MTGEPTNPTPAQTPPEIQPLSLPPSEFGADLTTRFFIHRLDLDGDGNWSNVWIVESSFEEILQFIGFDDPAQFLALTREQQATAAKFYNSGWSPEAAILAARNKQNLRLVKDTKGGEK